VVSPPRRISNPGSSPPIDQTMRSLDKVGWPSSTPSLLPSLEDRRKQAGENRWEFLRSR